MSKQSDNRVVFLNADVVLRAMRERGWSMETLALEADVAPGTVSAVLNRKHGTFWSSAEQIRKALQIERMETLLKSDDSECLVPIVQDAIHEWSVEQVLTGWVTASNQLQFQVCRLRHQHVRRSARGKRYELRAMSTEEQKRCRALFTRHAEVCAAIGSHPHVIRNITTCESPRKDVWWVIDEWVEGRSLLQVLKESRLSRPSAIALAAQVADGLNALHQADIVRRELSPTSILLCDEESHVVLTEFELAKLLDGSPTVSSDEWPTDPYRAPEANSSDVDHRADVYSWGRLVLHLLLGELPAEGQELAAMRKKRVPSDVEKILLKCVSPSRRSRPKGFDDVIDALRSWNGKS